VLLLLAMLPDAPVAALARLLALSDFAIPAEPDPDLDLEAAAAPSKPADAIDAFPPASDGVGDWLFVSTLSSELFLRRDLRFSTVPCDPVGAVDNDDADTA
jgi:hypothetical protein